MMCVSVGVSGEERRKEGFKKWPRAVFVQIEAAEWIVNFCACDPKPTPPEFCRPGSSAHRLPIPVA